MPSSDSRIRSALYVDFDNVFGALLDLDPKAAIRFANSPQDWLDRLALLDLPPPSQRAFLVRRCYLNPAGSKPDPESTEGRRLIFSRFRPFLTRAGFEVIDCPALTSFSKNASDILMAIDIVEALTHSTNFDEFVIFSADADFTPVLRRIREHDRQTLVVSSSQVAQAYRNVANKFVDEAGLIDLISPVVAPDELPNVLATADILPTAPARIGGAPSDADYEVLRGRAAAIIFQMLANSSGPILLTALAEELRRELGNVIKETNWLGRGALGALIDSGPTARLSRSHLHIWDPDRHEGPLQPASLKPLPEFIAQICRVTEMPRLTHEEYSATFKGLATFLSAQPFNLTLITQSVRDRLKSNGIEVGRNPIGFVVRGSMYGGIPLNRQPPPEAEEIALAFRTSILHNARSSQMEINDDQERQLTEWLSVDV